VVVLKNHHLNSFTKFYNITVLKKAESQHLKFQNSLGYWMCSQLIDWSHPVCNNCYRVISGFNFNSARIAKKQTEMDEIMKTIMFF
jgi:hypothetical protein